MAINFDSKNKDGVHEVPSNRTLLIEKLTDLSPLRPEMTYQLKDIGAVFKYFRPSVNVLFESTEGSVVNETITFDSLSDFDIRKIARRSEYFNTLEFKKSTYFKIASAFKTQESLGKIIKDDASKATLLKIVKELKKEINEAR